MKRLKIALSFCNDQIGIFQFFAGGRTDIRKHRSRDLASVIYNRSCFVQTHIISGVQIYIIDNRSPAYNDSNIQMWELFFDDPDRDFIQDNLSTIVSKIDQCRRMCEFLSEICVLRLI